jgi:hypothetical protein
MFPRPAVRDAFGTLLMVCGAAVLGFGLGGLVDAAVRPLHADSALAWLRASSPAMALLGLALLLPGRALGPAWRGRPLAGALLIGLGLFGLAAGTIVELAPLPAGRLEPGSAALLIWSFALVAGGQCLFEQGEPEIRVMLRRLRPGSD